MRDTGDAPPLGPDGLFAFLDGLGIAHTTHRHPPLRTVEESKELRGVLPGGHVKNLFLRDKRGATWLVTAIEDTAIDLKWLAKRLEAGRFSFGSPERLEAALGVIPGAVTPFGLVNDPGHNVRVVLDAALFRHDPLNFHPLVNDATTAISTADFRAFLAATGHAVTEIDFAAEMSAEGGQPAA